MPTSLPVSRQPSSDPQTLAEPHAHIKRPARLQPASCQKTCPMGRAVSEDCQPASAALLHSVNPLPAITRSARLNKQRSGDFRLFPPANFANSAILPTDKISAFFMQNFLLQKPKDSSWSMPLSPHRGRKIAFANAVRSGPSALRGPLD